MKTSIVTLALFCLCISFSCKKDKKTSELTYPKTGLVSYFNFDDNLKDQKGYTSDGVKTGTPTFTTGKSGKALTIDAGSQFVTFTPINPQTSTSISVAFWVKSNVQAASFFINYASQSSAFGIAGNNSTYLFRIVLPIEGTTTGSGLVSEWNHVVCTYDGTNIKIYVNGELKDTLAQAEPIDGFNGSIKVGNTGVQSVWTGNMDEMFIYNRALTAAEVNQLYHYHL